MTGFPLTRNAVNKLQKIQLNSSLSRINIEKVKKKYEPKEVFFKNMLIKCTRSLNCSNFDFSEEFVNFTLYLQEQTRLMLIV